MIFILNALIAEARLASLVRIVPDVVQTMKRDGRR
jgi:hypothetical protein